MKPTSSRHAGFTLIELMVTVAVVGILAAIAYPSYQSYVKRSYRSDAMAALVENAQFLERNFNETNKYHEDASGTRIALPVSAAPRDGSRKAYAISLDFTAGATSATAYRLLATPVAGAVMDGDECGTLTLNQLGQKGAVGNRRAAPECWR